jgi:GNAT superfamily N-acetyltransferase
MEMLLLEDPGREHHAAILAALSEYNASVASSNASSLAIVLKEHDRTAGGLWGTCLYDWLAIELVFVPEHLRGQRLGTRLIEQAEDAAQRRGCIGAWLDTFSFQARGFYEKLGYREVGAIADHPRGGARYILAKRFS